MVFQCCPASRYHPRPRYPWCPLTNALYRLWRRLQTHGHAACPVLFQPIHLHRANWGLAGRGSVPMR